MISQVPQPFTKKASSTRSRRALLFIVLSSFVLAYNLSTKVVEAHSEVLTAATIDPERDADLSRRVLTITQVAGSGQTIPVNGAFPIRFQVLVTEDEAPQPGISVTFTVPAEGASGTFPDGSTSVEVATGDDGTASAPVFTANGTAGSYQLFASIADGSAVFDLTNGKSEQIITFDPLPNRNYGTADFEVTAKSSSGLAVSLAAIGHCTAINLTVHLTGAGSCVLTASQNGDSNFNASSNVRRSFFIADAGEELFDVRSFGAVGDGTANDSPAFQAALDAMANAGGGTLVIPEGRYALISPVSRNFNGQSASMSIRGIESDAVVDPTAEPAKLATGLSLLSEIFPRTGDAQAAVSVSGVEKFLVSDVAFVGTPNVEIDAAITLAFIDIGDAKIKHSEFYGLKTRAPEAGIVFARRSGLTIQDTKFLGSFGHSGTYTPNVQNIEWKAINISNVVFLDYGLRPELYCKCQEATFSWINIGNAGAVNAQSPRREASIRNAFFDEGAYNGLTSLPARYQPASAPIDLVYFSGLRMNVSNLGTSGNYLSDTQRVLITDAHYGWSHNASAAITLAHAGNAIVHHGECIAAANRIQADAATERLTVINSTYTELASQAGVTREIVTQNPDDDPVQYVRTKFVDVAGREPDPAAHFYWSNLLLECGDNDQCITEQREALDSYLNGSPTASVTLAGQIKDENGAALPNVTVTLAGSQAVTTQTDANGRYSFAALPSSGTYTVLPALAQHTFSPASRTIATPTTNQGLDFQASLNRYLISGRVLDSGGAAISSVTVNLSGSQVSTTTTDATGNYSFTVAVGDYLLTPSHPHYSFSPHNSSLTNVTANQILNFSALLNRHTISGRIVNALNVGVANVTISLSGTQTASLMTDSTGGFSFTGLAAGGDFHITPSRSDYLFVPASYSFTDLSADQSVQITGNPPPPQLVIDPNDPASDVLTAVDSVLLTNGPFRVRQAADWLGLGVRNTRVMLFANHVTLETGNTAAAVVVSITDANNQTFQVPAEDVRRMPNAILNQIVFRLPDNLAVGTCQVKVIFLGQTGNVGVLQITQ